MADLIDRQAVIDLLKKNTTRDIEEVVVTEKNIKLIMDMPKAYDVEKVVAELEEYKKQWMDSDYLDGVDEIIDIVKRGGVE